MCNCGDIADPSIMSQKISKTLTGLILFECIFLTQFPTKQDKISVQSSDTVDSFWQLPLPNPYVSKNSK